MKTLASKQFEISTELEIVRLILRDHAFLKEFYPDLSGNLFREQLKPIVEVALKYYQEYGKLTPNDVLVQELTYKIGHNFTIEKRDAVLNVLLQLSADPRAPEWTTDQVRGFIQFQKVENISVEYIKELKQANTTQQPLDEKRSKELLQQLTAAINGGSKIDLVPISEIETLKVEWLWYPYIPLGKITIMEGNPAAGKTFVTAAISAHITNGDPFFTEGHTNKKEAGCVVFTSGEDGYGDTIKPRFEQVAKGDATRFFVWRGVEGKEGGISLSDLSSIENVMQKSKCKLMIFDPIQAFIGSKVDINRVNEIRPIMAGLARLAEKHGVAIVLIGHLNKTQKANTAYRGIGSIDLRAAARSVLLVGCDPNDKEQRVIIQTKNSLAPEGKPIGYTLVDHDGGISFGGTTEFQWTGYSTLTAEEILAPPEEPSRIDEAEEFLREQLSSGGKDSSVIKQAAKALDISYATLKRAKTRLKVKATLVNEKSNRWNWSL
jgi:hypothetical protein